MVDHSGAAATNDEATQLSGRWPTKLRLKEARSPLTTEYDEVPRFKMMLSALGAGFVFGFGVRRWGRSFTSAFALAIFSSSGDRSGRCLLCCLTFEVRRDRRQDARPGLVKMYRVPPARAWWPAVGPRLDRRVRRHWRGRAAKPLNLVGLAAWAATTLLNSSPAPCATADLTKSASILLAM